MSIFASIDWSQPVSSAHVERRGAKTLIEGLFEPERHDHTFREGLAPLPSGPPSPGDPVPWVRWRTYKRRYENLNAAQQGSGKSPPLLEVPRGVRSFKFNMFWKWPSCMSYPPIGAWAGRAVLVFPRGPRDMQEVAVRPYRDQAIGRKAHLLFLLTV